MAGLGIIVGHASQKLAQALIPIEGEETPSPVIGAIVIDTSLQHSQVIVEGKLTQREQRIVLRGKAHLCQQILERGLDDWMGYRYVIALYLRVDVQDRQ